MIKNSRRLVVTMVSGMLFGLLCVVVASKRFGSEISFYMLFSLWFNRFLLGILIGAPWDEVSLKKSLLRGASLGLIVSFAYFISTGFSDILSFISGIMQGMIFELIAYWVTGRFKKHQEA